MMKRILKRPMFKMGGDVENVGIMDGMRNRYQNPPNAPVGSEQDQRLQRRLEMINRLTPRPNLNQFLIDFGLNLASGPPRGNILSTAAAAARDPFQRFMAGQQAANKTRAALAIEALTDDDRLAIERQAELMANNPKSQYFNDKQGALNALFSAKLAGSDEYKKIEDPDVTSYRTATEKYRMPDTVAKRAVPYITNIIKIDDALKKENIFLDEDNPFKFNARKRYVNGAAYIEAGTGKLLRYDEGQKKFIDISDLVDLSEVM